MHMDSRGEVMKAVLSALPRMTVGTPEASARTLFLAAAAVSFVLSVSLWFAGHQLQGIFVGLWVPSILSLGTIALGSSRR